MKLLSIIIPIFNVEPYLERCLRGLENQDVQRNDYEIICINDGSPDNSREIVKKLQTEFDNIILIDQENQGVSRARNNGMEKACGRYLLFIDPDDFVHQDTFAGILNNITVQNAQVSFLGFTLMDGMGNPQNSVLHEEHRDNLYSGIDAYHLSRGDGRTDPDRTWAVLFEREFLNDNNLRYLPDVPYLEDGELIARILCLADRCIFDSRYFYLRTARKGSATRSMLIYSDKAVNGFILAACNLKKFREQGELNDSQKKFMNQPICKFTLLPLMSTVKDKEKFKTVSERLKSNGLRKCVLKGCNNFYRIEGFLYNLNPCLYLIHRKLGTPLLKLVKP